MAHEELWEGVNDVLTTFGIFSDQLLSRRTEGIYLFKIISKPKNVNDVVYAYLLQTIINKKLSKCKNIIIRRIM